MLKGITSKIKIINKQLEAVFAIVKHYKLLKRLSSLSLLSDKILLVSNCKVCGNDNISLFVSIPLGIPGFQNHFLLYFNKSTIEGEKLLYRREIVDKALGFFLSVPWYFCGHCKNATLGINIDEEHLLNYYSNYYKRKNPSDNKRRATKELHGKFLNSLLNRRSKILEIGAAEGFTAEYLANEGHLVYVYEPSNFQATLKDKVNLKFINNLENDLNVSFDAIYMHHTLEHIYNPVNYLNKLNSILKMCGTIFIQVPDLSLQVGVLRQIIKKHTYIHTLFGYPLNVENVAYNFNVKNNYNYFDALLNDHITAFTPEGLRFVLESSGYTIEKIIQSTSDKITVNNEKYSWPVDETTGNTPNGLTIVAKKL